MIHRSTLTQKEIKDAIAFWLRNKHSKKLEGIVFEWLPNSEYWNHTPDENVDRLAAEIVTKDV
jgi:hypothetical protein